MRTPSATTSAKADEFRRLEVITGVARRRRWTDEEKAWIVAESLDPATSVSAVVRVGADVDAAALRRVLEVVRGLA